MEDVSTPAAIKGRKSVANSFYVERLIKFFIIVYVSGKIVSRRLSVATFVVICYGLCVVSIVSVFTSRVFCYDL